jgi:hypothetical protein
MGYSPASILTSGALPNLQAIHYEREAIPNLKAQTPFLSMTKQKPLPLRQGNQIQFYTYALLGANINQTAEGTVGSPISESTTKILATIGQYADFINSSDLALDVAIDDPGLLQNLANELNYRLALTLNTLTQMTSDAAVAVDANVNIQLANGSYLTANNIRSAVQSLETANVRALRPDGMFGGIIHPNVVKDVYNDTSFNGLTDILKRGSEADRSMLMKAPSNDSAVTFAGVTFKQTSTARRPRLAGIPTTRHICTVKMLFSRCSLASRMRETRTTSCTSRTLQKAVAFRTRQDKSVDLWLSQPKDPSTF